MSKQFDFGTAINKMKDGNLVTRAGWNGKGMFLFMRPEDSLPVAMLENFKSLPQSVKDYYRGTMGTKDTGNVTFTGYICMKAADDTVVNGWLASQTDILSNDWMVYEI